MGCCGVTYQEEVEAEIINFLKTIKKSESLKMNILREIKEDLQRRASTVDRYYYPYRTEDVERVVKYYKNYIFFKLKGDIQLYEVKKKEEIKLLEKKKEENKIEGKKNDENIIEENNNEGNKNEENRNEENRNEENGNEENRNEENRNEENRNEENKNEENKNEENIKN